MGVSTEQWRIRIGLFGGKKCKSRIKSISLLNSFSKLSALLTPFVIYLLLVIGNVELNPGPFPCKFCAAVPDTIASSLSHQQFHSKNSNFKFFCPAPECGNLSSCSFGTIRSHVSLAHPHTKHRPFLDQDVNCEPQPQCFKCEVCDYSSSVLWDLVQHLYVHLTSGVQIPKCPLFSDCDFQNPFKKKSTFQVHLSQYHKNWNPGARRRRRKDEEPTAGEHGNFEQALEDGCQEKNVPEAESGPSGRVPQEEFHDLSFLDDELVTEYIAKFYLQLYGAYFLPYDRIQEICNGLTFISEIMYARVKRLLTYKLQQLTVPEDDVNRICFKVMRADLLYGTHHKNLPGVASLTTDYLRKKYFQEHMGYKPPTEISLDHNNVDSDKKYQYVPIHETLEGVLQDLTVQKSIDESFCEQSTCNDLESNNDIVSNYTDGSLYKSEQHHAKETHIIMYQDGYNPVMNVLGSAKNKFKSLAVYFTIGNLKANLRSKVASKHLVMIIRESVMKIVGPKKCFEKLVENLKKLEETGISYKELLLKYGPLIHLWSLPYEQMHKMFKTICRLSRNFKNVEYTCAVRHQMHLAYLGTGLLFPEEQFETGSKLFLLMSHSGSMLNFLRNLNIGTNWTECKKLHVNGLIYQENDLLLLSTKEDGSILVGFIKIILTKGSQVQFILESFLSDYHSDYGVYQIPCQEGQYALVARDNLSYPVPQPTYNFQNLRSFSLKNKLF
ncbi:Transcriptional regulator STP3 [Frankliniella fusca]|uniref:Transcriptional regulator STP3 n=1 Tax=Frankliniella fusca TaxID=407009 RepID=A0AAE1IV41_9NEOP|nr:Transcriptional regulator STP3 [Frankliniella fusca]